MSSPLSPIVANLYMEYFEKKTLDSYPLKPTWWKRFVDYTNLRWTHGRTELENLFNQLNSISSEIKIMMEFEQKGIIPFLDVLVIRKEDGTLGHQVFKKKTHTESYLHANPYHHPSQKIRVLRSSDTDHLNEDIKHLASISTDIGYKEKDIKKDIKRAKGEVISKGPKENCGIVYLPFLQGVRDKVTKVLRKRNILLNLRRVEQLNKESDMSRITSINNILREFIRLIILVTKYILDIHGAP